MPSLELSLTEKDGKTRRPLSVPSVLHTTWRLPDGRRATLFACIADKPVTFTAGQKKVTLEPGQALFQALPRKPWGHRDRSGFQNSSRSSVCSSDGGGVGGSKSAL